MKAFKHVHKGIPIVINGRLDDLDAEELQCLDDWIRFFKAKYTIVGELLSEE